MAQMTGVERATGRDRAEWFALLDEWGAAGRPYKEISEWLTGEHDLSRWWAQKLIVEYEEARGIREPGARRNGTYEVGASKTVAVPVTRAFDAFVDSRKRNRWLTDGKMLVARSEPGRSARFWWQDGSSRVSVTFEDKGSSKATVTVIHNGLPNAKRAQAMKAKWRARLNELKSYLED